MTPVLVGCDWGTSSFRCYLIGRGGAVLAQVETGDGILSVPAGGFADVLERGTRRLGKAAEALPVLISGMAGSRQGWIEAPYVPCPAPADTIAAGLVRVPADRPAGVWLVPGLSVRDEGGIPDVLRGEEVQVLGALLRSTQTHGLFLLPGTHSKWVMVEDGAITTFATFMTGEVYATLREHTILGRLMAPAPAESSLADEAFRDGVSRADAQSAESPGALLHLIFSARTRALMGDLPAHAIADYLSGLLIGSEWVAARAFGAGAPTLIGAPALVARYATAASVLGIETRIAPPDVTASGLRAVALAAGIIDRKE